MKNKLTLLVLITFLSGGILPVTAQFSISIRQISGQSESSLSAMQSSRPLMTTLDAARLKNDRTVVSEVSLPYPWNPKFRPSELYSGEFSFAFAPSGDGSSITLSSSLLASNVTNILEITANSLQPEKLYQLLVASNVTGPYVPESDFVEAISNTHTWLTTNHHPIGFYQVQEFIPPCPPTVTITYPTTGTEITNYDNIFIYATASACSSNQLVRAVLFDNGIRVGWLTSSETNLTNLVFELSTRHLAFGEHSFRIMVEDDALRETGDNGYVAYSEAMNVTVKNPIWFVTDVPLYDGDFFTVAADSIYVAWASVIDDVRVSMEIRKPNGDLFWEHAFNVLPGQVETYGPALYNARPGFVDGNGNSIYAPDPYYDLTLTVTPIPTQQFAAAEEPLTPPIVKRFYAEHEMPSTTNAEAIVAYQLVFNPNAPGNAGGQAIANLNTVRQTFSAAYANPLPGGNNTAFEMTNATHWGQFLSKLLNWTCRTAVYFGHGGENSIGLPSLGEGARTALLRNRFGNLAPFNGGTNIQPYRAVFLFGCNTANPSGDIFEAFLGIKQTEPKSPNTRYTLFDYHGLTPRAGYGFTGYKYSGAGSIPDTYLYQGVEQLTAEWAKTGIGGTYQSTLQGAVTLSRKIRDSSGLPSNVTNPAANKERIVGDDRIRFQ